jgi:hypothetical protein
MIDMNMSNETCVRKELIKPEKFEQMQEAGVLNTIQIPNTNKVYYFIKQQY